MAEPVVVSIIICTRNRADSLKETLAAIGSVEVPKDMPAELLVVDSASNDHTAEVVRACSVDHMPFRYIREARAGLSIARNRGLVEAQGSILLFTDDDVRPSTAWIDSMCRPLLAGRADLVSGKVRIPRVLERPWMTRMHKNLFAAVEDWGGGFGLVGANMAFSRSATKVVPRFDPELGAGTVRGGEEGLYVAQLSTAGLHGVFADERSTVDHHFGEDRLLHDALKVHGVYTGRSAAYVDYHWNHKTVSWPWLRLLRSVAGLIWVQITHPYHCFRREGIHAAEWHQRYRIGYFLEMRTQQGHPRNYELHGLRKVRGILPA